MKTARTLATLAACGALAFAGCGDDDDDDGGGEPVATDGSNATEEALAGTGKIVEITADPSGDLAYTDERIVAEDGQVKIAFENPAEIAHDVVVADDGKVLARTDIITDDEAEVNVNLLPGEYTFYCSVDGHREAGMEGTLVVR